MPTTKIAPHETFDLHELLTFKNICATKSSTMGSLVPDEELRMLLQEDFIASKEHIQELQELLLSSELLDKGTLDHKNRTRLKL